MQAPVPGAPATPPGRQATRVWSPRQARWLLSKEIAALEQEDQDYRAALLDRAPDVGIALAQLQRFERLVREQHHVAFPGWLAETARCSIPELHGFAADIRREQAAVEAALSSIWSNGQTEGQINRLKTLKRQMYGRAKLDLLRQRFLYAA